ncbi:MAG: N-acetyl-gamma-glutamyl-phosphate reductase [Gammaproteobacteria bacterium]|nr:N-acetyl-gamma-glutamyl-phosphate reductase [Gammaproteobacteria bacterium]
MSQPKVYIDGQAGTTGLRIREWLAGRSDIELLTVEESRRKDLDARREQVEAADLCVLCLPDDAAREAVTWGGKKTRFLDASTAHRVADGWVYGLPELEAAQRESIRHAQFVSNPGCYPSAFVLLVRPLVDAGIIAPDTPFAIHALSGYSGGGRQLIERWEAAGTGLVGLPYEAPYALDKVHKHIPEMCKYADIGLEPQFVPAVGAFRCGMRVQVPLHTTLLSDDADAAQVRACWETRYAGETFVRVADAPTLVEETSFDPQACNDTNSIALHVQEHPSGHLLLIALLDNLGKGASGAAIQNMNIMLGLGESEGLPA